MEIDVPAWWMKDVRCGYCEQGELIFSQCPSCEIIVLICGECGTVRDIKDSKPGDEVGDISGGTLCKACGKAHHSDFANANSEAIQGLGFTSADYE
jgi:hypothetical protein